MRQKHMYEKLRNNRFEKITPKKNLKARHNLEILNHNNQVFRGCTQQHVVGFI